MEVLQEMEGYLEKKPDSFINGILLDYWLRDSSALRHSMIESVMEALKKSGPMDQKTTTSLMQAHMLRENVKEVLLLLKENLDQRNLFNYRVYNVLLKFWTRKNNEVELNNLITEMKEKNIGITVKITLY